VAGPGGGRRALARASAHRAHRRAPPLQPRPRPPQSALNDSSSPPPATIRPISAIVSPSPAVGELGT